MITPELLHYIVPTVNPSTAGLAAPRLQAAAARFNITSPLRVAHFLAQIGHESGFLPKAENLNYSAKRLCQVWPSRFPTLAAAQRCAYNPRALANTVYAGRMGNGGPESDDGWNFRGRGFIQITGRSNYRTYGRMVGYDLIDQPELALQYGVGALIAAAYWQSHGLNVMADNDDLTSITLAINGGLTGLDERRHLLDRAKAYLKIVPANPA